jgi:hypothetical protein
MPVTGSISICEPVLGPCLATQSASNAAYASEQSSDDSGSGDDPHQSSAVPKSLLQLQGDYASCSDSVVPATPEKSDEEQDGQSDGSEYHTPSKRHVFPHLVRQRQKVFLLLLLRNRIQMVLSAILYSIPSQPANAISSARCSLGRLSRNGHLMNTKGKSPTKKSRLF